MNNTETLLCRLNLQYPIIQAPMAGVSTPALAAAVSEAGGLGSLGLGACTVEQARAMIAETQALTDNAFNVNVFCHLSPNRNKANEQAWVNYLTPLFSRFNASPPAQLHEIYQSFLDNSAMLALLLEMKPSVVSFHFNIPSIDVINKLKDKGIYTMATATNRKEADLIEQAGIDAIIAQGIEAGGHRGIFDLAADDEQLTTAALVALLVQHTALPVIAAGGLMDGKDIQAALEKGAAAVQLGTAFLLCPESATSEEYRQNIKCQTTDNTTLTSAISGRPARGISNRLTALGQEFGENKIPDYPVTYDVAKQLNAAAIQFGHYEFAAHWAGQRVARSREMPARALVKILGQEMKQ